MFHSQSILQFKFCKDVIILGRKTTKPVMRTWVYIGQIFAKSQQMLLPSLCVFLISKYGSLSVLQVTKSGKTWLPVFFFLWQPPPSASHTMTSAEEMWKQNLVQFSVLVSWVVGLAVEQCCNTENNHIVSVSLKWLSVLSSGSFPRVARSCLSAGTRHVTLVKCLLQYLQAVMCHTDTHFYLNTHSTAAPCCDSVFSNS